MSLYDPSEPWLQPEYYYLMSVDRYEMPVQHLHHRCEIMYVLSGKARISVERDVFTLSHGQYIFLDEDVPHALNISLSKSCRIMNVEFSCRREGPGCSWRRAYDAPPQVRRFFQAARPCFTAEDHENFGLILQDLILQLGRRKNPSGDFIIANLMERMICALAETAETAGRSGVYAYVRRAVRHIDAHYAEPLTVRAMAEVAGVHPSYLQSCFKREFDCGVMLYINRVRISHAKFLLTHTRMSIPDIAAETGFNSRQNFALVFKKLEGASPSDFRRDSAFAPLA